MSFVKRYAWPMILLLALMVGVWLGALFQKSVCMKGAESLIQKEAKSESNQKPSYVGPFIIVPLSVALAWNGEGVIEMNRRHVVYVTRHRLSRDVPGVLVELSRANYWPGATKLHMSKAQKMEYKGLKYRTVLITPSYEKEKK